MTASDTLRYPFDLSPTADTDYIQFDFHKYQPPFKRGGAGLDGYNQTSENNGNDIDGNLGEKQGGSIHIYMPQDVSTSYAASWGGKEISNLGAGALSASANVGSGDFAKALENLVQGGKSANALGTTFSAALSKALLSAAGNSLTMNDVLGGTTGIILNPNVELFYGGPQIRNIGFAFKMSARNKQEAENIQKICYQFKSESLPAFGGQTNMATDVAFAVGAGIVTGVATGGLGGLVTGGLVSGVLGSEIATNDDGYNNFLTIPNLVKMQLKKGSKKHPYLSQYKALALTNVDINYTPDGSYSTFEGGFPTAVELRIGMVETKLIFKQDLSRKSGWTY